MDAQPIQVRDVVASLDRITGGRIPKTAAERVAGGHPFVMEKSSGIPGKAVLETPGLVCGDPERVVRCIGIGMTLTESMIELAGATGIDVLITHHPVADAANSGGVPLQGYLDLYGICLMELHEAFHGLHPGIAYLHGHRVTAADIKFAGIPGNIVFFGEALPEVRTAGDILARLNDYMGVWVEDPEINWTLQCNRQTNPSLISAVAEFSFYEKSFLTL